MKRALQPVQQPKHRTEIDITVVENVCDDVAARSAILEKLAWAWSEFDPGGINLEMDHDFWRGVGQLMRANRNDLARLYAQANGEEDGGAS
jgi:hypothetical protein